MKRVLIAAAIIAAMAAQVQAAGNLGIGTSTPASKLDVRENVAVSTTTQATAIQTNYNAGVLRYKQRIDGVTEWYLNSGTAEAGKIGYSTPGGGVGLTFFTGATYDQNRFDFGNYGTVAGIGYGAKGFFVVQASGYAGIGTTAPTAPLHVAGNTIRIDTASTPAQGSACNAGDHRWDANYIYVCTATNTWKRAALSTY